MVHVKTKANIMAEQMRILLKNEMAYVFQGLYSLNLFLEKTGFYEPYLFLWMKLICNLEKTWHITGIRGNWWWEKKKFVQKKNI